MISIIITVYNGEKYLSRCLDSLSAQTNSTFELILVDDGSKDGTLGIAKSYAERFQSFRIISYTPNKGVASARNTGLSAASGDYLTFIDCDDFVDTDAVEKMYKAVADMPEIAIFGYHRNDDTTPKSCTVSQWSRTDALQHVLSDRSTGGYLWNKLFSVQRIRDHKLRFHKSLRFGEDFNFCIRYLLCCDTIKNFDDAYYHYYENPESVTRVASFSHAKISFLKGISEGIRLMKMQQVPVALIHQYQSFYVNVVLSLIVNGRQSGEWTDKEREFLHKCLFRYRLRDINSPRLKLSVAICRCSEAAFYYLWRIIK